jgi:hypothetical protein
MFTNVSEVLAASIVRAVVVLMMEAVRTSETLVNVYQTTRATTQKTTIFVLAVVRTSNPTNELQNMLT